MKFQYFIIIFTLFYSCHSSEPEKCDKSQCAGPIKFYEDLNCKPVYRTPESCCPYKYDCDHLYDRSPDKCYINGHEYNIGEKLREEDAGPCDIGCFCTQQRGVPEFACAFVNCFQPISVPNCYAKRNATECCPIYVCPKSPKDRPTCLVDGKTYRDGEKFEPASDPEMSCYCGPGYNGTNVAPFCISKKKFCQPELKNSYDIANRCAPILTSRQSFQTDCSLQYKCQSPNDEVIPSKDEEASTETHDMTCLFGDKVMRYGDELTRVAPWGIDSTKCVCEVGPMLTCKQLPINECTNVAPFCISKRKLCQPELKNAYDIVNKCAPIFTIGQSPQTDCNFLYKCQYPDDKVISNKDEQASTETHDMTCLFGDKVLRYGDELTRVAPWGIDSTKCVCEVGPMLTCKQLPINECNIQHSSSL